MAANIFEAALGSGDTVLDVGANIGVYSAVAAHLVGPYGHVVALEPLPFAHTALVELVRQNGLRQVTVLPLAAASSERVVQLHITPGASGLTSVCRIARTSVRLSAKATTIDAVVARCGYPPPRLVKIDVEGSEFDVMRGADRLLSEDHAPLVLFETDPAVHDSQHTTFADIQNWLGVRRYVLFGLTPSGLRAITPGSSPLSLNTLAARPDEHTAVLSRLARVRFSRNQNM